MDEHKLEDLLHKLTVEFGFDRGMRNDIFDDGLVYFENVEKFGEKDVINFVRHWQPTGLEKNSEEFRKEYWERYMKTSKSPAFLFATLKYMEGFL